MNPKHLQMPIKLSVGLVVVLQTACGGGPTAVTDAVPVAFEIQSGDGQLFFPNSPLPHRLAARLVDENGDPVVKGGVPVTWQLIAGDGLVTGTGDTTSALGVAFADAAFGTSVGVIRIRLTADGIRSVDFSARATLPGPIAFVSNRRTGIFGNVIEGYPGDLYVMNEDGSDVVGLFPSNFVIQSLFDPAWSPDGDELLFTRAIGRPAGGTPGLLPIGMFAIDADGSGEAQVPVIGLPSYVRYFSDPAWSPDGNRIVANLAAEGVAGIPPEVTSGALHVMNRSGIDARPLNVNTDTGRAPDWDATNERLAFECDRGGTTAICITDENGDSLEMLTSGSAPDTDPAWSPDGSQLLFARDTLDGGGIWRINADGTGLEQIVVGRTMSPSWSPDGTRFVYELNDDGRIDVWLFNFASGLRVNLTNATSRDSDPVWRRTW